MLHVDLDAILPEEDAVQKIKEIFRRVEEDHITHVITQGGRPAVAIIDIDTLESFDQAGAQSIISNKPVEPTHTEQLPAVQPIEEVLMKNIATPTQPNQNQVSPDTEEDSVELPPMPPLDVPPTQPVQPPVYPEPVTPPQTDTPIQPEPESDPRNNSPLA
jgi:prevent-host-death family protein